MSRLGVKVGFDGCIKKLQVNEHLYKFHKQHLEDNTDAEYAAVDGWDISKFSIAINNINLPICNKATFIRTITLTPVPQKFTDRVKFPIGLSCHAYQPFGFDTNIDTFKRHSDIFNFLSESALINLITSIVYVTCV